MYKCNYINIFPYRSAIPSSLLSIITQLTASYGSLPRTECRPQFVILAQCRSVTSHIFKGCLFFLGYSFYHMLSILRPSSSRGIDTKYSQIDNFLELSVSKAFYSSRKVAERAEKRLLLKVDNRRQCCHVIMRINVKLEIIKPIKFSI